MCELDSFYQTIDFLINSAFPLFGAVFLYDFVAALVNLFFR